MDHGTSHVDARNPRALFLGAPLQLERDCRRLFSPMAHCKDQIIFNRGDASGLVFLIDRGRVRHSRRTDNGKEITLAILAAGDIFGEEALFSKKSRSTVARCLQECSVGVASAIELYAFLESSPLLALSLARISNQRMQDYAQALESFAYLNVRDRLMDRFTSLARDHGFVRSDGVELRMRMTHAELALLVGTSRETISLHIGLLKRLGHLRGDGRRIVLPPRELRDS